MQKSSMAVEKLVSNVATLVSFSFPSWLPHRATPIVGRIGYLVFALLLSFSASVSANDLQNLLPTNNNQNNTNSSPLLDTSSEPINQCGPVIVDECAGEEPVPDTSNGSFRPSTLVGNPISLVTGNKYQIERDYSVSGSVLEFSRHYNSSKSGANSGNGQGWSSTYQSRLLRSETDGYIVHLSTGGTVKFDIAFEGEDGEALVRSESPENGHLTLVDENRTEWSLPDGRDIKFNGSYLTHIDYPGQSSLTLFYKSGRLSEVVDNAGRTLNFEYTPVDGLPSFSEERFKALPGHLSKLTLPDGKTIEYDYDQNGNLTRVRYADNTSKEFHYENTEFPNHLTGISDRLGNRFATWSYNAKGLAVSSEHANDVEKVTLTYSMPDNLGDTGSTQVMNSIGAISLYEWKRVDPTGEILLLRATGPGCSSCPKTGYEYEYDDNALLISSTSVGGKQRFYEYDDQGRLTKIEKMALNAPARELEIQYEYDGTKLLPVKTIRPSVYAEGQLVVATTYNDQHLPIEITESGYRPTSANTDNQFTPIERTTKFSYEAGLLREMDGPRDDVDDTTRMSYDQFGRLIQMDMPSGETVVISQYDEHGRASEFRNGQNPAVSLTFDNNGNTTSVTRLGEAVQYQYNAENRLVRITNPNGKVTTLSYDEAQRLSRVTDDLGRTTELTFNTENQMLSQTSFGVNSETIKSLNYLFDAESRMIQVSKVTAQGSSGENFSRTLERDHDEDGLLNGLRNVDNGVTRKLAFNDLGRLLEQVEYNGLSVKQSYDVHNRLTSRTDKGANTTRYDRGDFGNIYFTDSPDTGLTQYQYDKADNRTLKINANGESTQYQWDAGNRIVSESRAEGKTTYAYDKVNGKLIETTYPGGSETYAYTELAQLRTHARHIDGNTFTTEYRYQSNGQLLNKILPDGQMLRYHYYESGTSKDTLRAITQESLFGLQQSLLVGEVDLDERDGRTSFLSHNGRRNEYLHHPNGDVASFSIDDLFAIEYEYDQAGNITGIKQGQYDWQRYQYIQDQLSSALTEDGSYNYSYDVTGNRTSASVENSAAMGAELDERNTQFYYGAVGTGNKIQTTLETITGLQNDYVYNKTGLPLKRAEFEYVYNTDQRPVSVSKNGKLLAEYTYNSFGERIKKVSYSKNQKKVTYFLYDSRTLTAEIDAETLEFRQSIHFNHTPVVHLIGTDTYAVHSDHNGTPKLVTDSDSDSVWQAGHTPLGQAEIVQDNIRFNLRLAGQYEDTETGTHYNYLRDYDPSTGRYLTSDPAGLVAGDNTYAYANNNPLGFIDPLGLEALFSPVPTTFTNNNQSPFSFPTNNTQSLPFDITNVTQPAINPSVGIPSTVDQGVTDIDNLVLHFNTYDGDCDETIEDNLNTFVNNSLRDDNIGYITPINQQIFGNPPINSGEPNQAVAVGLNDLDADDNSHTLIVAECTTSIEIRAEVTRLFGDLVHEDELNAIVNSVNQPSDGTCTPVTLIDLTPLYNAVLDRFQTQLMLDPELVDAEMDLAAKTAAYENLISQYPISSCFGPANAETDPHPASQECSDLLFQVVAPVQAEMQAAAERYAEKFDEVYDRMVANNLLPWYATEEEKLARRKEILLMAIGIIIPLTLTDVAIEVAFFALSKAKKIAEMGILLTKAGVRTAVAAVNRGAEVVARVERLRMERFFPDINNVRFADAAALSRNQGPEVLSRFDADLSNIIGLSADYADKPGFVNAWRVLDDVIHTSCSFDGSMKVNTPEGVVAIANLRAGTDFVLSKDEISGSVEYQRVNAVYANVYDRQVRINSVNNLTGEYQSVLSNEIHPIFAIPSYGRSVVSSEGHQYSGDISNGQWIDAADLVSGDELLNADGSLSTVVDISNTQLEFRAYNLTIENFNTYFIGAPNSDTNYWVHNVCIGDLRADPELFAKQLENVDKALTDTNLNKALGGETGIDELLSHTPEKLDTYVWLSDAGRNHTIQSSEAVGQIHNMLDNPNFIDNVGGPDVFAEILAAQRTGTPVGQPLIDHLVNTERVIEEFNSTPGFENLITDLKNGNPSMQEGIRFAMSQMKDLPSSAVARIDGPFDLNCGTNCRYDIRLHGDEYIEYKSYAPTSRLGDAGAQQMEVYFENAANFEDINYVFDGSKVTKAEADTIIAEALTTNAQSLANRVITDPAWRADLGVPSQLTHPDAIRDYLIDQIDNRDPALFRIVDTAL